MFARFFHEKPLVVDTSNRQPDTEEWVSVSAHTEMGISPESPISIVNFTHIPSENVSFMMNDFVAEEQIYEAEEYLQYFKNLENNFSYLKKFYSTKNFKSFEFDNFGANEFFDPKFVNVKEITRISSVAQTILQSCQQYHNEFSITMLSLNSKIQDNTTTQKDIELVEKVGVEYADKMRLISYSVYALLKTAFLFHKEDEILIRMNKTLLYALSTLFSARKDLARLPCYMQNSQSEPLEELSATLSHRLR